jgi:hypothetical protein
MNDSRTDVAEPDIARPILPNRGRISRVAVLSVLVTWLPLLILATIDKVAWGGAVRIPLLKDFLPLGQFLVAVPVLILGEGSVARHLSGAVAELRRSAPARRFCAQIVACTRTRPLQTQ